MKKLKEKLEQAVKDTGSSKKSETILSSPLPAKGCASN